MKTEFRIQTIVHATDFSAASRQAFDMACSLARDHAARLIVLNVIEAPSRIVEPGLPQDTLDELRTEAEQWFATLHMPHDGIVVDKVIVQGDPVAQILRIADEESADLIVMGTHGRTGMQRLLMGSVAENVLRYAQCPVLAVKTPMRQRTPLAPREASELVQTSQR